VSERRPSWRCLCGLTYVDHSIGAVVCPGYVAAPLPDWGQPTENAAREDEDEAFGPWVHEAARIALVVCERAEGQSTEAVLARLRDKIRAAYRARHNR